MDPDTFARLLRALLAADLVAVHVLVLALWISGRRMAWLIEELQAEIASARVVRLVPLVPRRGRK